MNPRPRTKRTNGLPPNLYLTNGGKSFIYKRPDNGSWHGMGKDRLKAIQAAKHLNNLLVQQNDLIESVMGAGLTLNDFITLYENEIVPAREWAKATQDQFEVRKRQIIAHMGHKAIDTITIRDCAELLDPMAARSSNQTRQHLVDILAHAAARGLVADNPAERTIRRIEKVTRGKHTIEGLKLIRQASPLFLQNAIDVALVSAQRREDIVAMRFDDERDDGFYVAQIKTQKQSDAGYIKLTLTPEFKAIITRCRGDDIVSPFLIHRLPDRLPAKGKQTKAHWTAVTPEYISRAFQDARAKAKPYPHLSEEEQPGFHKIRDLSLHLYKRAGKKIEQRKNIAGHTSEKMTRNYEANHDEIVWTEAVPDLDISEITGLILSLN